MLPDLTAQDGVLRKLILYYFQGVLNFVLKVEEIAELTWNLQQCFIEATVLNPLLLKYPINKNFSRLYLKKLIDYLEPHQEVHDELYAELCNLMDNNSKEDLYYYRHYVVNNDISNVISIRETNKMVVNGTTGMRTWEAGVMIADWAICNKELFKKKKVLELGSGVGLTGIAITKFCCIEEYIFTDCHSEVLNTLAYNVSINFPNTKSKEKDGMTMFNLRNKICKIGVMPLDWNDEDLPGLAPDIIIGADVVYDPCIIKPLCNVIQTFLNRNNNLEVYFATIIRIEETFKQFLLSLDERGLKYDILQQEHNVHFAWDANIERCLLKVY